MDESILFKFFSMEMSQFAILDDDCKPEIEKLEVFNRFQFGYNFDEHLIMCKVCVKIVKLDKLLLKANFNCIFQIEANSAHVIEKKDGAILPSELLVQFASLTYGSFRGVLYTKTLNTQFHNFILPPTDLTQMFKEAQSFKRMG